nr:immunoglobulin heavy chain junction region [Mus musculus]
CAMAIYYDYDWFAYW